MERQKVTFTICFLKLNIFIMEEIYVKCGSNKKYTYEISNFGNIKRNGIILTPRKTTKGYLFVIISKKLCLIHRLVAKYFIDNLYDKPEIDHIDGNPLNNNVLNLRWVTHTENMNNPITKQRISKSVSGDKNPFYGKKHTKETIEKIKRNLRDMSGSNNPMYKHIWSEDSLNKLRNTKKTKNNSGMHRVYDTPTKYHYEY